MDPVRWIVRLTAGLGLALVAAALMPGSAEGQRIKDIARVEGMRLQQMKGLGLVIGLAGTGDSTRLDLTRTLYANLLENMDLSIDPKELRSRNVAVVMVTARISSAVEPGSNLTVEISSMGDAKSLEGGRLLETPLFGPGTANRKVYAVAQGPVQVQAEPGTVGTGEAILEEDISIPFHHAGDKFSIILEHPDFSTSARVARAINEYPYLRFLLGSDLAIARPLNAGKVEVDIPERFRDGARVVEFISRVMGDVEVPDVDQQARVVIDRATSMVAVNGAVRVSPVVVILGEVQISIPPPGTAPMLQHPLLIEVVAALGDKGLTKEQICDLIRNIERAGALIGKLEER